MNRIDPIIAVKNIEASSKWYQSVFGCKRTHGGEDFAVLRSEDDEVLICLHKWGEHDHPTMINPEITPGNGVLLYFRTNNIEAIRKNVTALVWPVDKEIQVNPNTQKREFSLRDPDGYYLTITEFHDYEG